MANAAEVTKISTEAAERFVDNYYNALSKARSTIASFYIQQSSIEAASSSILFNGNPVPDGAAVQAIFDTQMPHARYEAQSIDCHVINPSYTMPTAVASTTSTKAHISILVLVSGWVRYGEDRSDPQRGFSETLVLVPNPQANNRRGDRRPKDFLIQSQNFRLVV